MENAIIAKKWLAEKTGFDFLKDNDYCPTRDIFQARLDKIRVKMEAKNKIPADKLYPLIAVMGEIGNNSFDHNLGKWRDITGIYFNVDFDKRVVVLADRGQGILASLQKVNPDIKTDAEAIKIAFTQKISGRFPENRGNGLKFVAQVSRELNLDLFLQSDRASARINEKSNLEIKKENENMSGVLAIIRY